MADDKELNELEKMVNDISNKITPIPSLPKDIETVKVFQDFDDIKKESKSKAVDIIMMLVNFYLTSDMANNEYTKRKVSVDVHNLTNLIYQMDTSQFAITKTLEQLDADNGDYRIYAVLANLQKSNLEILKYYKQYMQVMENEYTNFRTSYDRLNSGEVDLESEPFYTPNKKETNTYRGTKDLIEEMHKEISSDKQEIETSEFEDVTENEVDNDAENDINENTDYDKKF